MIIEKRDKIDSEQLLSILNLAQKFIVRIQTSTTENYSIDISASNTDEEGDRPDPLRVHELLIVACVLLLWCASIFIFIRHSELLRIRHRDLPFRSSVKPPMNLNTITVVDRTSDMVIHPKRRQSSFTIMSPVYSRLSDENKDGDNHHDSISASPPLSKSPRHTRSFDFDPSIFHDNDNNEGLLDPYRIPSEVRRSLLELHRKSSFHCAINPISFYSTDNMSRRNTSDNANIVIEKRYIQESPL